jgi:hypothetical protein
MVAYSFKRRFVLPIQVGLGLATPGPECGMALPPPKLQTIRACRSRHAYEGEEVQLYCGMRTKGCFLIGRGLCTGTQGITIHFRERRRSDWLRCASTGKIDRPGDLDDFAKRDGFHDWSSLREFWRAEHPGIDDFDGIIIFWKPAL